MDNSPKKRKTSRVQNRREVYIDNTGDASGNQGETLHASRSRSKEGTSKRTRKTVSQRSIAPSASRLSRLENALADQMRRVGSPFKQIAAISNPGTVPITSYPANQWWFESFRTVSTDAVNQVLRLQQEVLVGCLILSNRSLETEARQECYTLLEEVEDRIMGFMPVLGSDTEVILPLEESDAAFSQMAQNGMYILSVMWDFQWVISKGAKP